MVARRRPRSGCGSACARAFPLHFGERWEEARDIYLDRFRAIHLERLTPAAGPRGDAARRWRAQGIYLGVVSNKTGDAAAARGRAARLVATVRQRRRCRRRASRQAGTAPRSHLALAPSGIAAGRRCLVCRRHRGRHGMRARQRLRPGAARRAGRRRRNLSQFPPRLIVRRRGRPVSTHVRGL